MNALVEQFQNLTFWRERRQPQFFKRHIVHGVALIISFIGGLVVIQVPSVRPTIVSWLSLCWSAGELFYLLRKYQAALPHRMRVLEHPRVVWLFGFAGLLATALLIWLVLPDPDYQKAFPADVLWAFFLVPLVYVIRHGTPRHFFGLLAFSLLLLVCVRLAVLGWTSAVLVSSLEAVSLLGLLAMSASATLQGLSEKDARVKRLNKITARITNRQELKTRYDSIARIIREELRYPVVHIMLWDAPQGALVVKGAAGKPRPDWRPIKIAHGQGLTGHAFEVCQVVRCNNVLGAEGRRLGYVSPPGYGDIRSELVVPLTHGKEHLGLLDFQSTRRGEFDDDDVTEAQILANAITIAIKWNQTTHTHLLLWKTISRAQRSKDIAVLIDEILEMAQQHLNASLITFYPLIPETGLPLCPLPYRKGTLLVDESQKGGLDSFQPASPVYVLLRAWRIHFSADAVQDLKLRGNGLRGDDFIGRERIQSVVFLPLGELDDRLGVLFINYREYREFSPAIQSQIRAFGAAFTLAIRQLHARARAADSLRMGVHRNIARYLYRIRSEITGTRQVAAQLENAALNEQLQHLEASIRQMRGHALRDTGGIFDLPPTGLQDALQNAYGSLKPEQGTDLVLQVAPELEQLTRSLHVVLYNLTVEALVNALAHGRASHLRVDLVLSPTRDAVECEIADNGSGFDPQQVREGPYGVFTVARWIQRELNGQVRFIPREDGGMRVAASIPILNQWGG